MNKNTWITILVCLTLCLATLGWQKFHLANLEEDVADRRAKLSLLAPVSARSKTTPSANSSLESNRIKMAGSAASDNNTVPRQVTAQNLLQFGPEPTDGPTHLIRMLPQLLALLDQSSSEEIFQMVADLMAMEENKAKAQSISGVLLMLLTGVEPEACITFVDKELGKAGNPGTSMEIKTASFAAMARHDTDKARLFLESANWNGRLLEKARISLFQGMVRHDLVGALDYAKDQNYDSRGLVSGLAFAARDPEIRAQIAQSYSTLEDPAQQAQIATSLAAAAYSESGFAGVDQLLSTMNFADSRSRDGLVEGAANMAMLSQPAETVEWVLRESSPERRDVYLGNSMRSWTNRNYNQAAEWLQTRSPSPETDIAISAFATTVVNLDQEAAAIWTSEIQDPTARDAARRQVLTEWHRRAPDVATTWMEGQGLAPADWVPSLARQE